MAQIWPLAGGGAMLERHSTTDNDFSPSRTERPLEMPFHEPEIVESPMEYGTPRPSVEDRPETFDSPNREAWESSPQPGYPDEEEPGVAHLIATQTPQPSKQDVRKKARRWSRHYGSKILHRLWGYVQRTLRENKTGLLIILPSARVDQMYPQAKHDLSNLRSANSSLPQSTIDPLAIPLDESLRPVSLTAHSLISAPFNNYVADASAQITDSLQPEGDPAVPDSLSNHEALVNQSEGEPDARVADETKEEVISAIAPLDWPQRIIVVPNEDEEDGEDEADFSVASQPQQLVVEGYPSNRSTPAPDSALEDVTSQPEVVEFDPDTGNAPEMNDPPTPGDGTTPSLPFAPSKPLPLDPVGPLPLDPVGPLPLDPVGPLPFDPLDPPIPPTVPGLPPLPSRPEIPLSPPDVGDPDVLENNETDQPEQPPTQLPITNDRPPTDTSGTDSDVVLPDRDEPDNNNDVDPGDPSAPGENVIVDTKSLTFDASNGTQTFLVKAGQGTVVIENFTGVGRGATPSPDLLSEIDTIQFEGAGLIADRLILDQNGSDVIIRFMGATTTVILENVEREDLDNLPLIPEGWTTPVGNILFDGDRHIIDSFDVFNIDSRSGQVFGRGAVTFLNDLDNEVTGFNSDDTIHALDGHDAVSGYDGDDTLVGNEGDDTLLGGAGDDTLIGGAGDDILVGGAGDDILVGGAGDNLLKGNSGHDQFVITHRYPGVNIFQDFDPNSDTLVLDENLTWRDLNIVHGVSEKTGEPFTNIFIKETEELLAVIPNRNIDLQLSENTNSMHIIV